MILCDKIYIKEKTFYSLKNLNQIKDNVTIIATAHNNINYKKFTKIQKLFSIPEECTKI